MVRTLGVLMLLGAAAAACSGGSIRKVDGGANAGGGTGGTSTGGAGGTSTGGTGGTSTGGAGGTSTGGVGGSDAAVDAPDEDGAAGGTADAGPSTDVLVEARGDVAANDAGASDAAPSDVGADATGDLSADVGADASTAKAVKVSFTGQVVTVSSAPLGFDSTVRLEAVSGSFTYDLRMVDQSPGDLQRGRYEGFGLTAFMFTVKGHTVTGSGNAQVQTDNLDPDTFRFLDGPLGDALIRVMKFDGADAPTLKLGIAITDSSGALLSSDALPNPFPTIDITMKPHTFSLQDSGGTMLMQLDTLTPL